MAPRDENQPDEDQQNDDIDDIAIEEGRVHHMFSRIFNLQILNLRFFFAKFKIKN